jgi:hypothetical protein
LLAQKSLSRLKIAFIDLFTELILLFCENSKHIHIDCANKPVVGAVAVVAGYFEETAGKLAVVVGS